MDFKCGDNPSSNCVKAAGCKGCLKQKLNKVDYLSCIPPHLNAEDFVEVQFKNTRKGYYLNSLHLPLSKGDMVAVEASPGHDIGEVTLTGKLVELEMRKSRHRHPNGEPRRIYRIAKPLDMDKYRETKALEEETMIRSRQIAKDLGLEMKIGDVEYQGDGLKAIFYYIADSRVDFRQLIKKLSEAFHIRVEMKQIGARQEAGRIGGIGPCGRHLCCSAWMTNFISVGTNAARLQDLSMNPQKLAGQCAKLKCCLNYEVDTYFEANRKLPSAEIELVTASGTYRQVKREALAGLLTYVNKDRSQDQVTIPAKRAFGIIAMNKRGETPFSLLLDEQPERTHRAPKDILDSNSLTRFDKPGERKKSSDRRRRRGNGGSNSSTNQTAKSTDGEHSAPTGHRHSGKDASRSKGSNHRRPRNRKGENAHHEPSKE